MNLSLFTQTAKKKAPELKKSIQSFKRISPRLLDEAFHAQHEAAFQHIDCLTCANCCKTTSPIFTQNDIALLAKGLKIKPAAFIAKYLKIDADGDYVLLSAPCPFLGNDNYCSVYENRPKACREYPHTDRRKMHQILDLTYRNALVCPAVFEIVNQLHMQWNKK